MDSIVVDERIGTKAKEKKEKQKSLGGKDWYKGELNISIRTSCGLKIGS